MQVKRFDRNSFELKADSALTPEGFIHCEGVTTRAGVFQYLNKDGSMRRELRHPEDVFDAESLSTMRMLVVVNTHQGGFVSAGNAKQRQIGHVGENVRADGMRVVAPVRITTQDGISAVHAGRRQLSLGYMAELEPAPAGALFDGEPYDFRQRNIRYNHLAIVDAARAGAVAQLKLDEADAVQVEPELEPEFHFDGDSTMKRKITLDGVDYEVDPQVAVALEKAQTRADTAEAARVAAETEAKAATKRADEATAKMDQAVENAKTAKAEAAKNYDADVKTRVNLVLVAQDILDGEALKGIEKMDNDAIRVAVIKTKTPTFDGKDQTPDYIRARFDAVLDTQEDSVAAQRQEMRGTQTSRQDAALADPEKARQAAMKRMDSAPADYLKKKLDERTGRRR